MLNYLKQPFPYSEKTSKRIIPVISISLFVFAFLYVFSPFGLNSVGGNQLAIAAGYGAVTFMVTLITNVLVPILFPRVFNDKHWNILREIIYILIVISLIAFGNLIYSTWLGFMQFRIKGLIAFEFITLAVAIIPVAVLSLVKQNVLLRRNLVAANNLTAGLSHKERLQSKLGGQVTISAENQRDNFTIEAKDIYYLSAADNYIEVYYGPGNEISKKLIRSTMRNAQQNLKAYSQFYRCHRGYIVNLEKVKKVSGNAQGYRLVLQNLDELIPVSRSLNNEITLRLGR